MTTTMTREQAIEILTTTIIGEEIGLGGYSDSAAYKLCNGDISDKTAGLSDDVRQAIEAVETLEWEEIGR